MLQTDYNWSDFLAQEFKEDYFKVLNRKLNELYASEKVFPAKEDLFSAFMQSSYHELKVVIVGQDPYHQVNQAHGLAFSVNKGMKIPPSLRNIYKELSDDMGCEFPTHGCLQSWAQQGVLLLNASLSVAEGKPLSHQKLGWDLFYHHVLKKCNSYPQPLVFILWGKQAQAAKKDITDHRHLILESVHPSPLSAYQGFFGSKPFSQTNAFLKKNHREEIKWCQL